MTTGQVYCRCTLFPTKRQTDKFSHRTLIQNGPSEKAAQSSLKARKSPGVTYRSSSSQASLNSSRLVLWGSTRRATPLDYPPAPFPSNQHVTHSSSGIQHQSLCKHKPLYLAERTMSWKEGCHHPKSRSSAVLSGFLSEEPVKGISRGAGSHFYSKTRVREGWKERRCIKRTLQGESTRRRVGLCPGRATSAHFLLSFHMYTLF